MRGACGLKVGTIVGPVTTTQAYDPERGSGWLNTTADWVDLSPAPTGADDPPADADAARSFGLIPVTHERRRSYDFDGERLKLASDSDRVGRCHHCAITSCTPK